MFFNLFDLLVLYFEARCDFICETHSQKHKCSVCLLQSLPICCLSFTFPHVLSVFHTFFPSATLSAALSPTAVKQMPPFIPPSGDPNTSFPVAWHWRNHKLGQMGD